MIRAILLAALFLDQLSKAAALKALSFEESIPVLPPFFHLTLVANPGVAFGLFKGHSWLFVLVGLLILFWVVRLFRRQTIRDRWISVGLSLVAGGAIGNCIDRLRFGYVVDFLDFRIWPVFNLADSFISVGTFLLIIACFKEKCTRSSSPSEH